MPNQFYGFYEHPEQPVDQPTYDPPHDAPCLYCGEPIAADDIRTISMMGLLPQYAKRCYFYRVHRTCDSKHKKENPESNGMDEFILDMIARNGD